MEHNLLDCACSRCKEAFESLEAGVVRLSIENKELRDEVRVLKLLKGKERKSWHR